ncbi:glycosyltransferase family 2 protein [Candidatus Solirubrobacter pratensis]|uniref:glycosyltransferase family 2 protein n=1 Tax=Candidatus Solirubrobacter pratensis TaxID=1298857 RepID=UPI0004287A30|nr:glycosyltransferase family 2 protein [Candidatus Solirubrobacter pratensis]
METVEPGDTRPLLSVVVPAYNEAGVIGRTLERLSAVAGREPGLGGRIEVIVVSDGSADATFDEACDGLHGRLEGRVVELATNAGSHAAIRCGLRYATGDFLAVMAADGQDPPEALPDMLERLDSGFDVVWGRRRERRNDPAATRLAAAAYYRLFRLLTGLDYPPSGLDFLMASRRVIEAVLQCSARNSSLFLLIYNLGFAQAFVDYERGARGGGRSNWTVRKRAKLAVDMVTSYSAAPIRLASLTGVVACLAGIALGVATVLRAAIADVPISGWATLMVVSSLAGGSMLMAIGLLGEYVWRILDEVRAAPPFIEARRERRAGGSPPRRSSAAAAREVVSPRVPSADQHPGLNSRRLVTLMKAAVRRLELDLEGRTVVTEAATGAYAVTPVLAAMAGARRVLALASHGPYGTADEAAAYTREVAAWAGVEDRIELVASKPDARLSEADIVTNSGHLRPLDAPTIAGMKRGAAISLMYEAWELRPDDVDVDACCERGIRVGGTNERHPNVDVFSFLGVMAVKLLTDAGVGVTASRILLLCDNPYRAFIERGLTAAGAVVEVRERLADGRLDPTLDAVLVALRPRAQSVLDATEAQLLAAQTPGAVVAQYWGDIDREGLLAAGVPVWPAVAPQRGHMGILPSAVGPEPIVRLQAGGLKVGEVLCKEERQRSLSELGYVQWVVGAAR